MADNLCLGVLLGQVIGRWGNFFNRESFGEYTSGIQAIQLPLSAVRSGEVSGTMRDNLLTIDGISYIQVQPVFLYESLWCLVILLVLLALRRRREISGRTVHVVSGSLWRRTVSCLNGLRTDKLCIPGTLDRRFSGDLRSIVCHLCAVSYCAESDGQEEETPCADSAGNGSGWSRKRRRERRRKRKRIHNVPVRRYVYSETKIKNRVLRILTILFEKMSKNFKVV